MLTWCGDNGVSAAMAEDKGKGKACVFASLIIISMINVRKVAVLRSDLGWNPGKVT